LWISRLLTLAVSGIAAAAAELFNRTPFNALLKVVCLVNLSMADCQRWYRRSDSEES
jgi:hypothetical protein